MVFYFTTNCDFLHLGSEHCRLLCFFGVFFWRSSSMMPQHKRTFSEYCLSPAVNNKRHIQRLKGLKLCWHILRCTEHDCDDISAEENIKLFVSSSGLDRTCLVIVFNYKIMTRKKRTDLLLMNTRGLSDVTPTCFWLEEMTVLEQICVTTYPHIMMV